ncbi:MAG: serine/threonine protein kinase [Acidobacteria bacterium]|nr:serine/threonine protein kinase [Acidobacteriota bacterium]
MIGRNLGHYKVQREIGAGGMGVVYEATDSRLRRSVAIKMLRESLVRNTEHMARFEREARVLASLNHANIATIHGLEEADGSRFLVMEYVPGKTLAERISARDLKQKEVLAICRDVAEALEAAHERGIIHRDLKPSNIKITPDSKVKVLDFGLAKAVESADPQPAATEVETLTSDATQAGLVVGTVAYMSPEQACGKLVDRRTDIWAFGCVLYEALCGKRTFQGGTTTELLAGILEREPDWNALPATVPENVRLLLRRCLQKDIHARLHDIGDARLEIEDALAGRGTAKPALQPRLARRRMLAGALAGLLLGAAAAGNTFLDRCA